MSNRENGVLRVVARSMVVLAATTAAVSCTAGEAGNDGNGVEPVAEVHQELIDTTCKTVAGVGSFCVANLGYSNASACNATVGGSELQGTGLHLQSNGGGVAFPESKLTNGCCGVGGCPAPDGGTFAYLDTPLDSGGNVQMIARVTSITNATSARAGIMLRSTPTDPTSPMGTAYFWSDNGGDHCTPDPALSLFHEVSRPPLVGSDPNLDLSEWLENSRVATPFWLKFMRIGSDYAVFRSSDTVNWLPLGGGYLPYASTSRIGLFVANGSNSQVQTVDATFDNISFTTGPSVAPDWTSSWIGSSYSQLSTDFVSSGLNAFYVSPAGWSYKDSVTDEQYHEVNIFGPTGTPQATYHASCNNNFFGYYEGGIAGTTVGSQPRVYLATRQGSGLCGTHAVIEVRTDHLEKVDGSGQVPAECTNGEVLSTVSFPTYGPIPSVRGLSALGTKVYVSEAPIDPTVGNPCTGWNPTGSPRVRVADTSGSGSELPPIDSSLVAHPSALAPDVNGGVWVVDAASGYPVVQQIGANYYEQASQPPPRSGGQAGWTYAYEASIKYLTPPVPPATTWTLTSHTLARSLFGSVEGAKQFNPIGVTLVPHGAGITDDELLVADSGPNQNVFSCKTLQTTPTCTPYGSSAFLPATSAGLFHDPSNGGDRRFYSPLATGVDSSGNVFVASGAPGVDIRKFDTTGALVWQRIGLGPDPGSFDPKTDGADFYSVNRHYHNDTTLATPGKWATTSLTVPPYNTAPATSDDVYPMNVRKDAAPIVGATTVFTRRLASTPNANPSTRSLFTYEARATGQLYFYRFVGEQAIPYGSLMQFQSLPPTPAHPNSEIPGCVRLWVDNDGNNKDDNYQPNFNPADPNLTANPWCSCAVGTNCELTFYPIQSSMDLSIQGGFAPFIDDVGSLFLGFWHQVWEIKPTWPTGALHPAYSLASRMTYADLPEFDGTSADVVPHFDASTNTMYAFGQMAPSSSDPACSGACEGCQRTAVVRYDNWEPATSTSTPSVPPPHYVVVLPEPQATTDDQFFGRYNDPLCQCPIPAADYRTMHMAGDMFFAQESSGKVRVFNAHTGLQVSSLYSGPEVDGFQYTSDYAGGMQVFRNSSNAYLVTEQDSMPEARNLLFQWTPPSGVAGESWSPANLLPRAWFAAGPDSQLDGSGAVSRWVDKSGHGHDLTNDVAPWGRPPYLATGWNGNKPTVSFDGTKVIWNSNYNDLPAGDDKPFSVLAVIQPTTLPATPYGTVAALLDPADNASMRWAVKPSGTQALLDGIRMDGNGTTEDYSGGADLGTGRHVVAWRYGKDPVTNQDRMRLTVDGTTSSQTPPAPALVPLTATHLIMGATNLNPNALYQGNISELVIVPRDISSEELETYRTYASTTWGGVSAGVWSPSAVNPSAWYDAQTLSTLTLSSTNQVIHWADRGTREQTISNADSATEPAYQATGWPGGKPVVSFAGSKFLWRDWILPPTGLERDFTVAAVVSWPTTMSAASSSIAAWWNQTTPTNEVACRLKSGGSGGLELLDAFRKVGTPQQELTTTATIAAGQHVLIWIYDATARKFTLAVDGTSLTSATALTALGKILPERFFVGATNQSSEFFAGNLAELVVVPRVLTTTERSSFRSYAMTKWGSLP